MVLMIYSALLPTLCFAAHWAKIMRGFTPLLLIIYLILSPTLCFAAHMVLLQIPQALTEIVVENKMSALTFIIVMNLLMLVLGAMLETVSIVLLTMPLVTPILHALGIDTIWYGVILTVNMTMALVTLPVGMNLYVICDIRPLLST